MRHAIISGTGSYLPEHVMTNEDLTELVDTSDEWIVSRTGIKTRRISAGETTSDLAYKAALKALENAKIKVRIWDFAGHTVTHAVHQFFLSERCLYIIVYDGRTEERNRLEYWLNHKKNYGGDSKVFIFVNRRDHQPVEIPINSLQEKYQYSILGLPIFSIKDDKLKLEMFRTTISNYICNNPSWNKQEIPQSYFSVKDALENIFLKNDKRETREYISKDEFVNIAQTYNIGDTNILLHDLHCLGVSLWYSEMEAYSTLVLNPEWISHGVYKIINWASSEKRYSLTLHDFIEIFKDELLRYPIDKHRFLFDLMKHYELAYETKQESQLIIPHLLREDRPDRLPNFPVGESLLLRYHAEQQLPPNTISRFIVRHNHEIKKENNSFFVWRYGVVLNDINGNIALVREEDRTINVSVKGPLKTEYISILRETLNNIFNSYKSAKPELQYRIKRYGELTSDLEERAPLWLPERKIYTQSIDKVPYYDEITGQNIHMSQPLEIYNISAKNLMMNGTNTFIDRSVTNFNFYNCNINLQGSLNELSQLFVEKGKKDLAKELSNAANVLEKVEKCDCKDELLKKGILNRLKHIIDDLSDDKTGLGKTIKGIRNGISITQDIAKGYNEIAQWVGLPQIPRPFLKK